MFLLLHYFSFFLLTFFSGTLLFFGMLWLEIFYTDTLFFNAVICLIISSLINIILIKVFKKLKFFNFIDNKDIFISIILFLFFHYTIYGLVPFNVSRSASFIMMGYFLENKEKQISKEEITLYVKKIYFEDDDAIYKRLMEQEQLGYLKNINGNYQITNTGAKIIKIFGNITKIYNTKKNYALPKK